MSNILIVVDMQHDFIDGSLANPMAEAIIPNIQKAIKSAKYDHICYTLDTHQDNYLNTAEGKILPVKHCIKFTEGWRIHKEVYTPWTHVSTFHKPTFGSIGLLSHIEAEGNFDEVTFCGTCTDICVISNVLILKAMKPELKINVLADCCAGTTKKNHEAALQVMKSCQINVI